METPNSEARPHETSLDRLKKATGWFWVISAALTIVGALHGTLEFFDWVERILTGWRTFLHTLWEGIANLVPEMLRPYKSEIFYDLESFIVILAGALWRGVPRFGALSPSQGKLEKRIWGSHNTQSRDMLMASLIAAALAWPTLTQPEKLQATTADQYGFKYIMIGVSISTVALMLFTLFHAVARRRLSSFPWLVGSGTIVLALAPIGFLFQRLPHGIVPVYVSETRAALTGLVIGTVLMFEFIVLVRRRSDLLWQLVLVAGSMVLLGVCGPIIRHAFEVAGWSNK